MLTVPMTAGSRTTVVIGFESWLNEFARYILEDRFLERGMNPNRIAALERA